jgi:hypothetical protein
MANWLSIFDSFVSKACWRFLIGPRYVRAYEEESRYSASNANWATMRTILRSKVIRCFMFILLPMQARRAGFGYLPPLA